VTGGIVVTVVGSLAAERMDEWRAGRRVRLPVMLHRPSRYLDPGVPDHERALARRGTTLVGTVKSGALVEVLERAGWYAEAISGARAFARRAIADAVGRWSAQSGAIVAAIVIGDRAGLDTDVQRRLQEAGTYHVIAISGGNIAILAGLLLSAFRIAGWLGRTAMLSSIAALLSMDVGRQRRSSIARRSWRPSTSRRAVDQRSPPLNALAVVAAILVATDPLSADPAFVRPRRDAGIRRRAGDHSENGTAEAQRSQRNEALAVSRSLRFLLLWPMFVASVAAEALLFPVGALTFSR
jgi:competence protein ComEC